MSLIYLQCGKAKRKRECAIYFFWTAVFALFASEKVLQRALLENAGNVRFEKVRAEAETGFLRSENGLRCFWLKITQQKKVFFVITLTKDLNFCFHE